MFRTILFKIVLAIYFIAWSPLLLVGLVSKELTSKSRVAHIKTARQVAMFLLSTELGLSTNKIANEVGVKDHTTVMHGIKKIKQELKLNFILRDQIEEIKEKIYG